MGCCCSSGDSSVEPKKNEPKSENSLSSPTATAAVTTSASTTSSSVSASPSSPQQQQQQPNNKNEKNIKFTFESRKDLLGWPSSPSPPSSPSCHVDPEVAWLRKHHDDEKKKEEEEETEKAEKEKEQEKEQEEGKEEENSSAMIVEQSIHYVVHDNENKKQDEKEEEEEKGDEKKQQEEGEGKEETKVVEEVQEQEESPFKQHQREKREKAAAEKKEKEEHQLVTGAQSEKPIALLRKKGHQKSVSAMVFTKHDEFLISASTDASILVWPTKKMKFASTSRHETVSDITPVLRISGHHHQEGISSLAIADAEDQFILSGGKKGQILCHELSTGHLLLAVHEKETESSNVSAISVSSDFQLFAAALRENSTIMLFRNVSSSNNNNNNNNNNSKEDNEEEEEEEEQQEKSKSNNNIGSGVISSELYQKGKDLIVDKLSYPAHDPFCCCFIPGDNSRLVSGGADSQIIIWNVDRKLPLYICSGHQSTVLAVRASRNQRYVASGSFDASVMTFSAESGSEIASKEASTCPINSLDLVEHVASHQILIGSDDCRSKLLRLRRDGSGMETEFTWNLFPDPVTSVKLSNTNRFAVCGLLSGSIVCFKTDRWNLVLWIWKIGAMSKDPLRKIFNDANGVWALKERTIMFLN